MSTQLNIFDYEPRRNKITVDEKENNVTRAFLNTLKNSPKFNQIFFNRIKIPFSQNQEFVFQTSEAYFKPKAQGKEKYLMYISKRNYLENENQTQTMNPRPDGSIIDDKNAILIEAKVNAHIDQSQISLYKNTFFNNNCILKTIYWEEIYDQICGFIESNETLEPVELFVLTEFKRYMEAINLNTFKGIPFFSTKENEIYTVDSVKYMLKLLRNEYTSFKSIKLESSVRPMSTTWDAIFLKELNSDSNCHYSLSIHEKALNIEINLIGESRIKKVLTANIYDLFVKEIAKLKDDKSYYLEILDYHKLKNKDLKEGQNHVQRGEDYETLVFSIQLKKLKKLDNWEEKLLVILQTYVKLEIKNLQLKKKLLYNEEQYRNKLSDKEPCLNIIESTFLELEPLYRLLSQTKK